MPELEDVAIQLLLATLYFVGIYIIGDVFWPNNAFQYALIGQGVVMVGYLILYALGMHKSGPAIGAYVSLGVAVLAFGLIWLVVREILRVLNRWPLDQP